MASSRPAASFQSASHGKAKAFFSDIFGAWPNDVDQVQSSPNYNFLLALGGSEIGIYRNRGHEGVLVKSNTAPDSRKPSQRLLGHEVGMTLLAGPDCALPIVGREWRDGTIYGFVTPYCKSLTWNPKTRQIGDSEIRPELCSDYRRLDIISDFLKLFARLRAKGIVHGNIRPSNLVVNAEGRLRFIDFAEATLESEPQNPRELSARYLSPSYCRKSTPMPFRVEDDLYAAGVTIWQIYTNRTPFWKLDEQRAWEAIELWGLQPELELVDNARIQAKIAQLLREGDPEFYAEQQSEAESV